MWKFAEYKREELTIPDPVIMSMRTGLEARYAKRFETYTGASAEIIAHSDAARQNSESLRTAAGIVTTQQQNIDELFSAAELMVKMINDFQRKTGVKQIDNIPLPGHSVSSSYGKKLGYVKLVMNFVSAGLLHFMEISLNMKADLDSRARLIKAIAEHSVEIPVVGAISEVEIDDLSSDAPIIDTKVPLADDSDAESVAPLTDPLTPPKTPKPQGTKPVAKPASPTSKKTNAKK